MSFAHTPSYTFTHPDRYVDDETRYGYFVISDTESENPIAGDEAQLCCYVYQGPRGYIDPVPDNLAAHAFQRFWDEDAGHDDDRALMLTRRWLRAFHPDRRISIDRRCLMGPTQSNWGDVFIAVDGTRDRLESALADYRRWFEGAVWIVTGDDGQSFGGILADTPEDAIAKVIDELEDQEEKAAYLAEQGEDLGELDPFDEVDDPDWLVTWTIGSDEPSPAEAAAHVWQQTFRRGSAQPGPEDACVFTVERGTGSSVQIDLSQARYAHLFEDPTEDAA